MNNTIYKDMIEKQLPNIQENKLTNSDILRISNKLNENIFTDNCVIYNGTYYRRNNKYYIPFYYKYKKISLTRILFINYVEEINSNFYIKYTCNNKGLCCCLSHMKLSKKNNLSNNYLNISNNNHENRESNDTIIVSF